MLQGKNLPMFALNVYVSLVHSHIDPNSELFKIIILITASEIAMILSGSSLDLVW